MKKSTWENIKEYLNIYWTMFIIGITTFGGGYAMVAIIERELGEKKKWIEPNELLDYIAIAQITPGIIAVNTATFVGRKMKGLGGAIAATLGVITPSLIIIIIIAAILTNFYDNVYVMHAFAGIRVVVCALIINATIKFFKSTVVDWLTFIVFICVFVVAAFTNIETVFIVLAIIAISVILSVCQRKKKIPGLKVEYPEKNDGDSKADTSEISSVSSNNKNEEEDEKC